MTGRLLILIWMVMLVGCATSADPGFFFTSWVGHPPANAQEEADGRACYDKTIAKVPAAFRTGLVAAKPTIDYKACLREKGYTLDSLELNDKGEWVRR